MFQTPVMESVFPEALSGWVDICIGADGEETEDTDRPVGLVDIGGRTTDIAVALPGFQIDPDFYRHFRYWLFRHLREAKRIPEQGIRLWKNRNSCS